MDSSGQKSYSLMSGDDHLRKKLLLINLTHPCSAVVQNCCPTSQSAISYFTLSIALFFCLPNSIAFYSFEYLL